MCLKELLNKNIEGLDESLDMMMHYIRETLIWRHRANELANAIINEEPIPDIIMLAKQIQKQLENK
jgi:hypothetical protein